MTSSGRRFLCARAVIGRRLLQSRLPGLSVTTNALNGEQVTFSWFPANSIRCGHTNTFVLRMRPRR